MTHIGHKIEEIVRLKRFPIVEFARKINTTRNNIYNIFSRESIDTELLRNIGEILEFDFFCFLSKTNRMGDEEVPFEKVQEGGFQYTINVQEKFLLEEKIRLLNSQIEQLKARLADKEDIIKLLKKRSIMKERINRQRIEEELDDKN